MTSGDYIAAHNWLLDDKKRFGSNERNLRPFAVVKAATEAEKLATAKGSGAKISKTRKYEFISGLQHTKS